jgi:hypothetical protein
VRSTVDHGAQIFREHGRPDPRYDAGQKLTFALQLEYKGYTNADPGEKQHKALTVSSIRQLALLTQSKQQIAILQLIFGAFFFAMRSCEYCKVSGTHRPKCPFFRGRCELPHDHPELSLAHTVSIMFEYQTCDQRNELITQHRTGDRLLCPVRAWAKVIKRILSYPGTNKDTQENAFFDGIKLTHIQNKSIFSLLRTSTSVLGRDSLGFAPDELGLHSIQNGAAMAMYLEGVPVFTIMLLGRWSFITKYLSKYYSMSVL